MSERTDVLVETAAAIETLRRGNPMNGDGSNYMLDQVLDIIVRLAAPDEETVAAAVREVRDERVAGERAFYERLEAENARRAANTPTHPADADVVETAADERKSDG